MNCATSPEDDEYDEVEDGDIMDSFDIEHYDETDDDIEDFGHVPSPLEDDEEPNDDEEDDDYEELDEDEPDPFDDWFVEHPYDEPNDP